MPSFSLLKGFLLPLLCETILGVQSLLSWENVFQTLVLLPKAHRRKDPAEQEDEDKTDGAQFTEAAKNTHLHVILKSTKKGPILIVSLMNVMPCVIKHSSKY